MRTTQLWLGTCSSLLARDATQGNVVTSAAVPTSCLPAWSPGCQKGAAKARAPRGEVATLSKLPRHAAQVAAFVWNIKSF